jgi:hypothetical protein
MILIGYPPNLVLDLCALLSGKAVATGDGDESDGSEKEQPGKGKGKNPAKDKAKRRVKKSAMVIQDDAIEESQFRDVINSRNCH